MDGQNGLIKYMIGLIIAIVVFWLAIFVLSNTSKFTSFTGPLSDLRAQFESYVEAAFIIGLICVGPIGYIIYLLKTGQSR